MIRFLDLPGAQALEDHAILHGGTETPAFGALFGEFCKAQFSTPPIFPNSFSSVDEIEDDDDEEEADSYEAEAGADADGEHLVAIRTPCLAMDEDIVDYLLTLGWDLRNQLNQPLAITKHIALTIECVALGAAGNMPATEQIEADKFGRNFAEDARAWQAARRGK